MAGIDRSVFPYTLCIINKKFMEKQAIKQILLDQREEAKKILA